MYCVCTPGIDRPTPVQSNKHPVGSRPRPQDLPGACSIPGEYILFRVGWLLATVACCSLEGQSIARVDGKQSRLLYRHHSRFINSFVRTRLPKEPNRHHHQRSQGTGKHGTSEFQVWYPCIRCGGKSVRWLRKLYQPATDIRVHFFDKTIFHPHALGAIKNSS